MVDFLKHDVDIILEDINKLGARAAAFPGATREQRREVPLNLLPNSAIFCDPRRLDGAFNNRFPGKEQSGASDTIFPCLTDVIFRDAEPFAFETPIDPGGPGSLEATAGVTGGPNTLSAVTVSSLNAI